MRSTGLIRWRRAVRGFTLWELMLTLSLLSIFGVVAGYLFRDSVQIMREADTSENRIVQSELMTGLLRGDVWSAAQVTAQDRGVELRQSAGSVLWTVEDGAVQRTVRRAGQADQVQRWTHLDVEVALKAADVGVVMEVRDADRHEVEQIVLPSQLMLLENKEAGR